MIIKEPFLFKYDFPPLNSLLSVLLSNKDFIKFLYSNSDKYKHIIHAYETKDNKNFLNEVIFRKFAFLDVFEKSFDFSDFFMLFDISIFQWNISNYMRCYSCHEEKLLGTFFKNYLKIVINENTTIQTKLNKFTILEKYFICEFCGSKKIHRYIKTIKLPLYAMIFIEKDPQIVLKLEEEIKIFHHASEEFKNYVISSVIFKKGNKYFSCINKMINDDWYLIDQNRCISNKKLITLTKTKKIKMIYESYQPYLITYVSKSESPPKYIPREFPISRVGFELEEEEDFPEEEEFSEDEEFPEEEEFLEEEEFSGKKIQVIDHLIKDVNKLNSKEAKDYKEFLISLKNKSNDKLLARYKDSRFYQDFLNIKKLIYF